ncbi:MAG: HAD-IA family hydrolase [Clostridia bacterium]|nr:HAD-IA family hydrolase [Clostridia bacterium]
MPNLYALLWDVDGTILDFFTAQKNALRACFARFGLGECSEEMILAYDGINHVFWERLERGEITKPEVLLGRFDELFRRYDLDRSVVPAFNDEYQIRLGDTICFYPHAIEVLDACRRAGVLQFAVTNGTKIAQTRKLARSGLGEIFDAVYISEDVGYEKPNPLFFAPVLAEIRRRIPAIRPEQMMIVGDSLTSDMQGGFNVGIPTCWYRRPGMPDADLPLTHVVSDLRDVARIAGVQLPSSAEMP